MAQTGIVFIKTGKIRFSRIVAIAAVLITFWMASGATATEISIPSVTAKPGSIIELPIIIDEIENLAGMKLLIRYDHSRLVYRKSSKTKYSSSLIHIVNDKKPGTLIVVMAGARGIRGKKMPVFRLFFQVSGDLDPAGGFQVKIVESQLMTDKLKNVSHTVRVSPIVMKVEKQLKKNSDRTSAGE